MTQLNVPAEIEGILDRFYSDRRNFKLKKHNAYSQATQEIQSLTEKECQKVARAYGGCTKCYGKGYATVKTQHIGYGTDGDIGGFEGPYKRDIPIQMKFCTCDRGKQLNALLKGEKE